MRKLSDAFLCGRVTYEVFKEFWPQAKAGEYRQTLNRIRKFVASRTLAASGNTASARSKPRMS